MIKAALGSLFGGVSGLQWGMLGLLAAMVVTILVLRAQVDAADAAIELLQVQRDQALDAAARNARAVQDVARHAETVQAAMGEEMAAERARAEGLHSVLKEIAYVADGTACPSSPGVRRALEHLAAQRVLQLQPP